MRDETRDDSTDPNAELNFPNSPFVDEEAARQRVLPMLAAAKIEADELPADTGVALRLLQEFGYRVSLGDLTAWLDDPRFAHVAPPLAAGRREWGCRHLFALVAWAEGSRRWDPLHPAHLHKSSIVAQQAALAEREGRPATDAVDDLRQHSLRDLLFLVVRLADPFARQSVADVLMLKCTSLGYDPDAK